MTPHHFVFVGESPPSGSPPDFVPFDCASGTLLAKHLGLASRAVLLARVPRVNLFKEPTGVEGAPSWSRAMAYANANHLAASFDKAHRRTCLALLGERVAAAFGVTLNPLHYVPTSLAAIGDRSSPSEVVVAPHPSGRSTKLNGPGARAMRQALLVDLVLGAPVRVLDFRLGDVDVLADLAHVVCPTHPQAAAAALRLLATANERDPVARAVARGEAVPTDDPPPVHAVCRVAALQGVFAEAAASGDPLRALDALFIGLGGLVTRREWGFGRKSDKGPYGDDLARAVRVDPTLARACASRAAEVAS